MILEQAVASEEVASGLGQVCGFPFFSIQFFNLSAIDGGGARGNVTNKSHHLRPSGANRPKQRTCHSSVVSHLHLSLSLSHSQIITITKRLQTIRSKSTNQPADDGFGTVIFTERRRGPITVSRQIRWLPSADSWRPRDAVDWTFNYNYKQLLAWFYELFKLSLAAAVAAARYCLNSTNCKLGGKKVWFHLRAVENGSKSSVWNYLTEREEINIEHGIIGQSRSSWYFLASAGLVPRLIIVSRTGENLKLNGIGSNHYYIQPNLKSPNIPSKFSEPLLKVLWTSRS